MKTFIVCFVLLFANLYANEDIFSAIEYKNSAKLKNIVEQDPKSVVLIKNDSTVLMVACMNDFVGAVDVLVKAKIDLDYTNSKGYSALMICSMQGNAEMVSKILQAGANPNLQNHQGNTALMLAAFYGNAGTAKILLNNGANKNITDLKGWNAADFAKAKHKKEVLAVLNSAK